MVPLRVFKAIRAIIAEKRLWHCTVQQIAGAKVAGKLFFVDPQQIKRQSSPGESRAHLYGNACRIVRVPDPDFSFISQERR
jgi:hypothetical protein